MDPKTARIALLLGVVVIIGQLIFSFFQGYVRESSDRPVVTTESANSVLGFFVLGCWVPDGDLAKRAGEAYEISPSTHLVAEDAASSTIYDLPGDSGSVQITHESNLSTCSVVADVPFSEMKAAAEAYFISDPRLPGGTLFDQDDIDAQRSVEHVSWAANLDSGARREAVRLSKTGVPTSVLTWVYVDLSQPISE